MPKIRLIEPGFESFTGNFGGAEFVDGVSVENLSKREVNQISCNIRCEAVDDEGNATGQAISVAESIIAYKAHTLSEIDPKALAETPPSVPNELASSASTPTNIYTREQLEAIADQKGIAGIREIADPLGIKGRSIVELIDEILTKQAH
ncbi:hypothetical protein [Methylocaldum szegediense]|uniref:hypothetical protein n=1 Tax=Methylocaldum szegediense TaxID=73780 RepID=UPI0003FB8734|nr:hypothetical protein [Methylocaldum szegediense]